MKTLLISLLLIASVTYANTRNWQEATVFGMTSQDNDNGAAVVPVGGAVYGVRLRSTTLWYRFDTADVSYIVGQVITGKKHPLNVTIHGKTKIAVDGSNLHILDDSGKDIKLPIVRKTAKELPTSTQ